MVITHFRIRATQYFKPQLDELFGDGLDLLFSNEEEINLTGTDNLDAALEAIRPICEMLW